MRDQEIEAMIRDDLDEGTDEEILPLEEEIRRLKKRLARLISKRRALAKKRSK